MTKGGVPKRKKGPPGKLEPVFAAESAHNNQNSLLMDRMFTPEEVAQHLSQKEYQALDTEMFSRDVPAEMFSSDSNDSQNLDVPYGIEN